MMIPIFQSFFEALKNVQRGEKLFDTLFGRRPGVLVSIAAFRCCYFFSACTAARRASTFS